MGLSEHERRQAAARAEEARRALRAAGLDPRSFSGGLRSAADVINRQAVAQQLVLTEKLVGLGIPALATVAASAWGLEKVADRWSQYWPRMTALADNAEAVWRSMEPLWQRVQPVLDLVARESNLVAEFQRAWQDALPPNVRGIPNLRISDVVDFMAEEGIPLYLVPRQATVEALLGAEGHGERRRLLGTHAGSIIADCREVWNEHETPRTRGWIDLLAAGVRAFEQGHTQPAQALFVVVIDSIMFAIPDRRKYVKHEHGDAEYEDLLDEEEFDTALVMIPIWSVYEENWERNQHPIPGSLNRHASLHRASTRQYSKRNAVQSLMLATSLLAWFVQHSSER